MSNIEPTEEQKQAAFDASDKHGWRAVCKVIDVARLLAEREAKLRERCVCIGVETGRAERDALRARVAELEARLARAVDIIVSEELDRDFGEPPTPRNLEVRALLTECGYQPERCSFGAVIGYSGTVDDAKADAPVCHSCEKPSPTVFDDDAGRPMCAACRGVKAAEGGEG